MGTFFASKSQGGANVPPPPPCIHPWLGSYLICYKMKWFIYLQINQTENVLYFYKAILTKLYVFVLNFRNRSFFQIDEEKKRKTEKEKNWKRNKYPVFCIQYPVSCILYAVSSILYPVSSILYPVSYIQHPVSSIHYPVSSILYLIFIIQYQICQYPVSHSIPVSCI